MHAPGEAEHQLVSLELQGITAGTITSDSDAFPLQSPVAICDLKEKTGGCCVVRREDAAASSFLGGGVLGPEGIVALCCFMDCDYLARPYRRGVPRVLVLAKTWQAASEAGRGALLRGAGTTKSTGRRWAMPNVTVTPRPFDKRRVCSSTPQFSRSGKALHQNGP